MGVIALEALILAGGNSTRMGQDKALLTGRFTGQFASQFAGASDAGSTSASPSQTLLARTCEVAIAHCDRVWVLTPRVAQYQPLLPPGCRCLPESRAASDPPPGPLVAFAEGLAQLDCDWVLLPACDLPGLTAQTLGDWLPLLAQAQPQTRALLPRGEKGWEPLCGFYRHGLDQRRSPGPHSEATLTSLREAIAQGKRSFQAWLATPSVAPWVEPLPLRTPLENCNTPEEWQRFQAR